jgi:hypothetical protein
MYYLYLIVIDNVQNNIDNVQKSIFFPLSCPYMASYMMAGYGHANHAFQG